MISFKKYYNDDMIEESSTGESYWITPEDKLIRIRPYGHIDAIMDNPELFNMSEIDIKKLSNLDESEITKAAIKKGAIRLHIFRTGNGRANIGGYRQRIKRNIEQIYDLVKNVGLIDLFLQTTFGSKQEALTPKMFRFEF